MEENAMEKTWENFWMSGKVTDYLAYRNPVSDDVSCDRCMGQEKHKDNGTSRESDGHGTFGHACQ